MNLKANQMSLGFNQMTRVRKNQNPELAAIKWLKVKNKFKTIKKNNSQRNLLINQPENKDIVKMIKVIKINRKINKIKNNSQSKPGPSTN